MAVKSSRGKIEPKQLAMARLVMVDGESAIDVAKRFEHTRQHVHRVVSSLFDLYAVKQLVKIPDTWTRVAVSLPPALAKQVKAMEKQALNDLLHDRK